MSRGSLSTTSPTPRVQVPRHIAQLVVWLVIDYFTSRRLVHRASRCLGTSRGSSCGSSSTTSPTQACTPRVQVPRHVARLIVWLVVDYFTSRRLVRRASRCLGTSRGSSSNTSPTSRVRVPRHVTWHVVRLVVDYSASHRLAVDYFTNTARPGGSARRAARHAARHVARRRLLHLCHASGCLGTSHGSLSTSSPTPRVRMARHVVWLVVCYFAYAACPGASARRAARLAARRRLLRLRCATGCLGTSRGSSRGSSLLTVYFGTPNMFITLRFGFDYGTNPPLGTLII
jgi:hypothetical protein